MLIMSFIGEDQRPALKVKEAGLNPDQMNSAYHQCIEVSIRRYMYCIIHLSM